MMMERSLSSSSYYHPTNQYHDSVASLAYRPLQLPLQQPQTHHQQYSHRQVQHQPFGPSHISYPNTNIFLQQQQHSTVVPVTLDQQQIPATLAFQQQNHHQQQQQQHVQQTADFRQHFSPHSQQQQQSAAPAHQYRTRAQTRQQQQPIMEYNASPLSEEDLAEMQQASAAFEPEVTGPLVGERQSTAAITTEYASADPVFQAKSASLPQKYSHYRTVRGDGNCGWRAVAFGYFEALVQHGDANRIAIEQARLTSMSNIMAQAGCEMMIMEDFSDMTFDLLREIGSAVSKGEDASALLMEKFNDDTVQIYIITHLKNLTASWMKTREEEYAPYLIGNTVSQYCDTQILPSYAEIDNVALSALKDVLLSPAGMRLEVLYLDRSEGSEVTMHRFDPIDGSFPIGNVRVLYRPGHYDLLYKMEDLPAPPLQPQEVATYLQYASQPHHEPVYDLGVPDFLTMIPGISYANTPQWGGSMSSSYGEVGGASNFFAANIPAQTCAGQAIPTPSIPTPQPQHNLPQPSYVATPTPTQLVPPPSQLPHDLPIRNGSHAALPHSDFHSQLGGGIFRPSCYQMKPDFGHISSHAQYQTAIFRNSHFNVAHFLNPDFQPEQWDPEDEYAAAANSGKSSSRHKSSG